MEVSERKSFVRLNQKIRQMVIAFSDLKQNNQHLHSRVSGLKGQLEAQVKNSIQLKDDNDRLKVVIAMTGDAGEKKAMKLKMNKLIKDVDFCITYLKNQ